MCHIESVNYLLHSCSITENALNCHLNTHTHITTTTTTIKSVCINIQKEKWLQKYFSICSLVRSYNTTRIPIIQENLNKREKNKILLPKILIHLP